jgi:hypothetical protein
MITFKKVKNKQAVAYGYAGLEFSMVSHWRFSSGVLAWLRRAREMVEVQWAGARV